MGTVSTALTEEALLKCLKRESYQKKKCDDEAAAIVDKDDAKCSICLVIIFTIVISCIWQNPRAH